MENIRNLDSEIWVYWTQNVALFYFDLFKLTRDCFLFVFCYSATYRWEVYWAAYKKYIGGFKSSDGSFSKSVKNQLYTFTYV